MHNPVQHFVEPNKEHLMYYCSVAFFFRSMLNFPPIYRKSPPNISLDLTELPTF